MGVAWMDDRTFLVICLTVLVAVIITIVTICSLWFDDSPHRAPLILQEYLEGDAHV